MVLSELQSTDINLDNEKDSIIDTEIKTSGSEQEGGKKRKGSYKKRRTMKKGKHTKKGKKGKSSKKTKKSASKWIIFVKNFAAKTKQSYMSALKDPKCKSEYHKCK